MIQYKNQLTSLSSAPFLINVYNPDIPQALFSFVSIRKLPIFDNDNIFRKELADLPILFFSS